MKYLKQFLIILVISLTGELLNICIDIPVPASIYGMVIMFVCLMTGIIHLEDVRETSKFLIEIMPVMFIPAGVGLMTAWGQLKEFIVPVTVITVVVMVAVMAASGRTSQLIIRRGGRKNVQ